MLLRIAALALLVACSGHPHQPIDVDAAPPDGTPCQQVGDPTQPVELQVVYRTTPGEMAPLVDGAELPVTMAPQGGWILVVGVRVRNVDLCGATVQVALRDPCDGHVAGIEQRPVAWTIAPDGFAEPAQTSEISDYANVPVCPNANIAQDIDGNPWQLEVKLYDAEQHATTRTLTVTPTCAEAFDVAECQCECDQQYGQTTECPTDPDGGVPAC